MPMMPFDGNTKAGFLDGLLQLIRADSASYAETTHAHLHGRGASYRDFSTEKGERGGQAVQYGVRFTGCTVHFVNEECDEGPIIIQAAVPVFPDDTEESLSARILKEEHHIYPRAIQLYGEGRLHVVGRRVLVDHLSKETEEVLIQPSLKV